MSEPGPSTRVVRAGLPEPEQGEPFLPGPVFAAPFHLSGDPSAAPASYTRYGNPTWARYEEAVGGLENAEAARGADLLWLESPSNPNLEVYDLAELARLGVTTVVDNTTAGPLLQRPLDLGAEYALTSATKHMSGHADLMLGYVTTRDAERADELRAWRRDAGALPGPFEAWLAHRSLPTLAVRLERACDNALAIARLLASREDVEGVRYPGLPGDPGHEVARRQMDGYGPVVSFDLGSRERAEGFLVTAELVTDATSFGSVHTIAERRARWGGDAVPEGFIRLSAGCEDTADLLADVERALGPAA